MVMGYHSRHFFLAILNNTLVLAIIHYLQWLCHGRECSLSLTATSNRNSLKNGLAKSTEITILHRDILFFICANFGSCTLVRRGEKSREQGDGCPLEYRE